MSANVRSNGAVAVGLVHHAEAVDALVDAQRPLSARGLEHAQRLAERARSEGVRPVSIWHSGKLRARQTAECFLRACNPMADFRMVRGLGPGDSPEWTRDALEGETQDVLLVSHMPLLPRLTELLLPSFSAFPLHGIVVLERTGRGQYVERWRAAG
jgi:phosphohistidine phosphatase